MWQGGLGAHTGRLLLLCAGVELALHGSKLRQGRFLFTHHLVQLPVQLLDGVVNVLLAVEYHLQLANVLTLKLKNNPCP